MTTHFDFVVLGQGLAGTALAWWLRWSGKSVLVIDREFESTASKIAAGLITPITGQKLASSWRHAEFWPVATSFYDRVERELKERFFKQIPMVLLLSGSSEVQAWNSRLLQGGFPCAIRQPGPLVNDKWFTNHDGGFEMCPGGQLDIPEYLRVSREYFCRDCGYLASDIDVSRDVELSGVRIRIPRVDLTADRIVFCQGFEAAPNPWFSDIQFKPAKGEILTLRIPGLKEHRVIHRGVWLAPIGDELFRAGSTYEWKQLDSHPTQEGRAEIVSKLREFLLLPFDVISHEAAVRPIHRNQHPVIGIHPTYSQMGYFNGLGSKGTLQAPYFAEQLARLLTEGSSSESVVGLGPKPGTQLTSGFDTPIGPLAIRPSGPTALRTNRPLTEQAQAAVRQSLKTGDSAVDATAGNGHDTQFLAELVGDAGTVFAFDIQLTALEKTAKRLNDRSLKNVVLLNCDHSQFSTSIPQELRGRIGAVMFNLGYLPGGDKQIATNPNSTRSGICQAAEFLRPGGVLTIIAYTGHDGGADEAKSVCDVLDQLPSVEFEFDTVESRPGKTPGPRMFVVKRRPDSDAKS